MRLFRSTKAAGEAEKSKGKVQSTVTGSSNSAHGEPAGPHPTDVGKKKVLDAAQSSRLLNRIIEHYGFVDYLEVGVQNGVTFNEVTAPNRDAVDPNFLFETDAFASETVRYFDMTSDEFFSKHADKRYDLIFLDGLHVFEQCLRDFCSSLQLVKPGGVIIIDDTVPGDFFSAMATQDQAIEARKEHGLTGRAWTGDVFKMVAMLNDYFPNLDYVTLDDPDNAAHKPNTVVWRGKRDNFGRSKLSLAEIEALGYFDLPKIRKLFNYANMDEGLATLFEKNRI